MAEADIFRAIRLQREAVNRSETAMLRQLARQWLPIHHYLEEQFGALLKLIQAKRDAGEPVQPEYLYSLQRYKEMLRGSTSAIRKYNDAAQKIITGAEADAVEVGNANATQLVNIAEPDDPMWTRVNKRETRIVSGMLSDVSPLSDLLNKSYSQTRDEIDKVFMIGLGTGQGSSWIAQQLSEAGQIPLQRALLIARTEVNRAYREANLETMRSSRAVRGYRRMCYPPTACFACLMLDGEYYEKLESFSDHPNGKCSAVPVTRHFDPGADPAWQKGRDWFMEQDEDTQRRLMGSGRFDLWKSEGVDPRDMVYIKPNPVWGGSPTMRTLEDLRNNKPRQFYSIGEHARLYRQYPNTVPIQALDAPGFTEKFKNITGNPGTDEAIYESSVEILKNCNGTDNEELHLIDLDTGVVIYKYAKSDKPNWVHYDDDLLQAISDAHKKGQRIVAVHNHPNGLPPTLDDGSSALDHGYDLGIAAGHNLEVWSYGKTNQVLETKECEALHNALNKKLQFMIEFDDSEWYNLLEQFEMKAKRL